GDDNPAINRRFPDPGPRPLFETRTEDLGGTEGWMPFSKGSLTGKPEIVLWNYFITEDPKYIYFKGRYFLELDLGQEYYVRGLDVLFLAPYMSGFTVWGKMKEEDDWSLLHMDDGMFVEPSKRQLSRRAYLSVRDLDSTVRYVRWGCTNGRQRG